MPKSGNVAGASAVQTAARKLRVMALKQKEDELLGSELDLTAALNISRPTLRQAGALVAQEHLIRIKRGVNGGYFVARPNSMAVARIAAIYLRVREVGLRELVEAVAPIRCELARLAAGCKDKSAREAFKDFINVEGKIGRGEKSPYHAFLRSERAFGKLLGRLSGNRVLELFLSILYDLAAQVGGHEDVYADHPERIGLYIKYRDQMASAIADGDEDMAILATRRCTSVVVEWLLEDAGSKGTKKKNRLAADGFLSL